MKQPRQNDNIVLPVRLVASLLSTHIRIVRRETEGVLSKIAILTARSKNCLESLKIAHYNVGAEFEPHCDAQGFGQSDADVLKSLSGGADIPVLF